MPNEYACSEFHSGKDKGDLDGKAKRDVRYSGAYVRIGEALMIEEYDLFSYTMPKFHIGDRPIRLIELFAGIGSQYASLKRIGANVESWKVVEWDKYAIASFNAVHGTNYEPLDIQKIHAEDLEIVDRDKYVYICTYSFPCQDISGAGHGHGFSKGSGTRSGLLWEVERILDECNGNLPHVLLMENVPLVIGKKNIKDFQLWRSKLESLGYSNYVQLLNAKDYGIPQNRNRCFMVSILGQYHYTFPKKKKLELKLKDLLEDDVDEKYYLSETIIKGFLHHNEVNKERNRGFNFEPYERERERESSKYIDRCCVHESNKQLSQRECAKAIQTKTGRPETEYIKE